ncbi:MAG: UDP-N-acetylmuramoyl-L-alanyl-D-glutamate--2,6-diaminopimelate ligase, partial [Ruthenibacterium sp.]
FGCAGERDAKKRPMMAEAIVKYADFAVLTSDNPRKEEPCAIIKDAEPVLAQSGKPYLVEIERRAALQKALALLQPGDVLVLCGKGHEDYQVIDGVTIYLDEHRIVREWLAEHGK